ncbi:MAG TPA: hypothetical protein VGL82_22195 [Bryobacteraceae bacterium]
MRSTILAVSLALPAFLCHAQQPATEPAPHWPDGHVNLGSAPDKKGYWETRPGAGGFRPTGPVPFQPWAKAVYDYRQKTQLESPLVNCKPSPGPSFFNSPGFEFVDVPELKSLFILNIAGPHSWRVVYMDGRPHPKGDELRPTFLGHSIGHWESGGANKENDTLVIDSVGFNEKQWTVGAYPTTSQLHLIERISRPNLKTLNYEATIDDPGAYTQPWTGRFTINEKTISSWVAGGEMFEYICEDAGR